MGARAVLLHLSFTHTLTPLTGWLAAHNVVVGTAVGGGEEEAVCSCNAVADACWAAACILGVVYISYGVG